jgi:hypothetical protein
MAFAKFFRRHKRDADTAREIASYIAIETDDNIARGMSPQAAHDAAVRKFGNATRVREEIYWMNTIRRGDRRGPRRRVRVGRREGREDVALRPAARGSGHVERSHRAIGVDLPDRELLTRPSRLEARSDDDAQK